jgi:hypothetical protein
MGKKDKKEKEVTCSPDDLVITPDELVFKRKLFFFGFFFGVWRTFSLRIVSSQSFSNNLFIFIRSNHCVLTILLYFCCAKIDTTLFVRLFYSKDRAKKKKKKTKNCGRCYFHLASVTASCFVILIIVNLFSTM